MSAALAAHPLHVVLTAVAVGLALAQTPFTLAIAVAAVACAAIVELRLPRLAVLAAVAMLVGVAVGDARLRSIDRPGASLEPGDHVEGRAVLLEAPRPGPFGSSGEVRMTGGVAAGARLYARLPREARLPPTAGTGLELDVTGAIRAPPPVEAGEFDFAAHLRRRGVAGELSVDRIAATGRARDGPAGLIDRWRRRAERGIASGLSPPAATLARGMVLGQDEAIDPATREDFRASGLAHVLAVSGQNVMLLAALALPLLAATGLPPPARIGVTIALIAIYVPVAGAESSLQRAAVMGVASLVALAAARPASRWYALLLAACVTLALNPRIVGDAGWQLSFAAVVGILALCPPLRRALVGLPRLLAEGVAVTVAATLATAPLLAHHFGTVSLASLPANVLALPLVAPIMWLGMLRAALGQLPAAVEALVGALAWLRPAVAWLGPAVAWLGPALAWLRPALAWLGPALAWLPAELRWLPPELGEALESLLDLLSGLLGLPFEPLLHALARLATAFAELPGSRLALPLGSPLAVGAAYIVIGAGALGTVRLAARTEARREAAAGRWRRARVSRRIAFVAAIAAVVALVLARGLAPPAGPAELTVSFLDVGQGDATLVQHPDGTAILFDGGPPEGRVAQLLRRSGVRRLAVLVLTHASRDHHGGLAEVVERYPVDLLLDGGDGTADREFRDVVAAARRRGARVEVATAPLTLRAGALAIEVLSPDPRPPGPAPEDPNARAVAAVVSAGEFDLFLSGDAESDALETLVLPDVEAMKIAHHGSADPGLPELLDRLRPEAAGIPVGENTYGHPTPSTLTALREAGVATWRTDEHGTVRMTVRDGSLDVRPERGEEASVPW